MRTQRDGRPQRGLATGTQRHSVFFGFENESLRVSVSLWPIFSVFSVAFVSRSR